MIEYGLNYDWNHNNNGVAVTSQWLWLVLLQWTL